MVTTEAKSEIRSFRNEVLKWGLITAAFAEAVSLPIIGLDLLFFGGLIAGTAMSVLGFVILTITGASLMNSGRKLPVFLGYLGRLIMYGVSFILCLNIGRACAFGCAAGFLTVPFGIMFLYGIYYGLIRKKENPLNDWKDKRNWRDLSEFDEDDDW